MKKLILSAKEITDEFFENTRLLGIIVTAKSYRFCWHLNHNLGYNFRLNNDIEIHVKKRERNYFFPVYQHTMQDSMLTHYIYHNQHDGEYLLPEYKHMDFLWLTKGDPVSDKDCLHIIQFVKQINCLQHIVELTHENIKNKGNLVF